MAKDPAVLFYTSDFLASTYHLSNEQVGLFIRLLCQQHLHGRISPEDMPSAEDKGNKKILDMFECDENGYYNKRMEEEILKRKSFCKSRRDNKTKSSTKAENSPVKAEGTPVEKAPVTNEDTPVKAEERVAKNEEKTKKPKEKNEGEGQKEKERLSKDFLRFWSSYPKKVAKVYCQRIFLKLKPSTEQTEVMIRAVENQKRWEMWQREDGKYIPNPSTWLNQQRWLDEGENTVCKQENEEKRMGIYL